MSASKVNVNQDSAFDSVTEEMAEEKSRFVEFSSASSFVPAFRRKNYSRRALLLQIKEHFSDEIAAVAEPDYRVLYFASIMQAMTSQMNSPVRLLIYKRTLSNLVTLGNPISL